MFSQLISYELERIFEFFTQILEAHENMNSYVAFNKESNQNVAVYQLFSTQILPKRKLLRPTTLYASE